MNKDMIKSVIGIIAFVIGALNMFLSANGYQCIEFNTEAVTQAVSLFITLGGAFWSTWKNFNWTKAAKDGQAFTDAVKHGDKDALNIVWNTVKQLKDSYDEVVAIPVDKDGE